MHLNPTFLTVASKCLKDHHNNQNQHFFSLSKLWLRNVWSTILAIPSQSDPTFSYFLLRLFSPLHLVFPKPYFGTKVLSGKQQRRQQRKTFERKVICYNLFFYIMNNLLSNVVTHCGFTNKPNEQKLLLLLFYYYLQTILIKIKWFIFAFKSFWSFPIASIAYGARLLQTGDAGFDICGRT